MWEIEFVGIGDEVLSGFIINTNAAFVAQELLKNGYKLTRQQVLPDNEAILKNGMLTALNRSRIVISTGGLGPTVDDITRKIAAEIYDSGFHYDDELAKDLQARYGNRLGSLADQATVPDKAKIILNGLGTAPGFIFSCDATTWILLPGIPEEMKRMFTDLVIPYIQENFPLENRVYRKTIHLFKLSESAVDPFLRELSGRHPHIEFGIYPSTGDLTIHLSTVAKHEAQGMEELNPIYEKIKNKFLSNFFESISGTIEEAIHSLFIEKGWTLSIAESCTGGEASARLTKLAGASKYFLGSIVCYSNNLKNSILNVPEEHLQKYGAVDEETARCLAEEVLKLTGSDFSLAVTGIAGPSGGSKDKPVGTVWGAICRRGEKPHAWKMQFPGNRQMVISQTVSLLFSHLLIKARKEI